MHPLIENVNNSVAALFEHVGFQADFVLYAIDDCTDLFWGTNGDLVRYAESLAEYKGEEAYYENDVFKHRFYDQWIYKGAALTMIICDPKTDNTNWFRVFDNKKEQGFIESKIILP